MSRDRNLTHTGRTSGFPVRKTARGKAGRTLRTVFQKSFQNLLTLGWIHHIIKMNIVQ